MTQKERPQRGNAGEHLKGFGLHIGWDLVDYAECYAMYLPFPRYLPTTSEDSVPFGIASKNLEREVD